MPTTLTRADGASLTFDHVGNVQVVRSGRVTRRPVEGGQDVSDGFTKNPEVIAFDGSITQTPVEGAEGATGAQRVLDARAFFEGAEGQRLTLTSGRDDLPDVDNMVLTRYPHTYDVLARLTFAVELVQVRVATLGSAAVSSSRANKASQAQRQDAGAQGTDEEIPGEKRVTILRGLAAPLVGG